MCTVTIEFTKYRRSPRISAIQIVAQLNFKRYLHVQCRTISTCNIFIDTISNPEVLRTMYVYCNNNYSRPVRICSMQLPYNGLEFTRNNVFFTVMYVRVL